MRQVTLAAAGLAILCVSATSPLGQPAPAIHAVPIPTGPAFPVAPATINTWISTADQTAMRGHAWALWAAMNSSSGQVYNGKALPVWETWAGSDDVFPSAASPAAFNGPAKARTLRRFVKPRQFHHQKGMPTPFDAADDRRLAAFNKFSPEAASFIMAKQAGPGGATYAYTSGQSLTKLNAAWPATTPIKDRAISEFPIRGMELKPVFETVKATGLSTQPLWRGPAGSTRPTNPTPGTWTTCVLIDPAGTGDLRPATKAEILKAQGASGLACKTFLYGPLSLFYYFRMTAADAQNFQAAVGGDVKGGDYGVLVAMHVNTKEVPNWTWQTFWWQPGADTPGGFPGSKAGQPASLPAPMKNYASCANYDQAAKPGGKITQVCFNPYLETDPGIPAGITSNCLSCHGVARIAPDAQTSPYPTAYKAPIAFFTDPKYYHSHSTRTDFSWAVADAP